MSLDLLDAPLRITWDLCPVDQKPLSGRDALQVADRLLEAGIFYLLLDERPLLHPDLPEILRRMTAEGCQVSLVLGDSAAEWEALLALKGNFTLFVDAGCWLSRENGLSRLEEVFACLAAKGLKAALLWVPEAGHLPFLYPLFELCARHQITRFKLPNHKIGVNPDPSKTARILQSADLCVLEQMLLEHPLATANISLEVHDLFLWELLFPNGGGERSEYGGCQAGNSLGHVSGNGDLWPCSSWPQALGSLLQQDLMVLWDSPLRFQVRAEVDAEPSDCKGCRDYTICFGGCRGLARSCRKNGDRRDLLCIGPR
ncbi:SPASM domain-containing protein [Geopsychrobacter electrodiphilus]|uniref:SPASM domain-containing protein n=1 Tax=Geopsychrobacter electrodiphilus TaxID=225196 RepID=UPI000376B509|nr:SPASM domain-containing protein [Geopsychrobacter electrodiphilus]